jgi:hypothetical protein
MLFSTICSTKWDIYIAGSKLREPHSHLKTASFLPHGIELRQTPHKCTKILPHIYAAHPLCLKKPCKYTDSPFLSVEVVICLMNSAPSMPMDGKKDP